MMIMIDGDDDNDDCYDDWMLVPAVRACITVGICS